MTTKTRLAIGIGLLILAAPAYAIPGYLIAESEPTDTAALKEFGDKASAVVKAHGGEYVTRRNKPLALIGEAPKSVTIVRFESMAKAQAYVESAEYKALAPLRDKAGKWRNFLVEGGDNVK